MTALGILFGLIGGAIGGIVGLLGGLFGLVMGLLGAALGLSLPLLPFVIITLGVIWLVKRPKPGGVAAIPVNRGSPNSPHKF